MAPRPVSSVHCPLRRYRSVAVVRRAATRRRRRPVIQTSGSAIRSSRHVSSGSTSVSLNGGASWKPNDGDEFRYARNNETTVLLWTDRYFPPRSPPVKLGSTHAI